MQLIEQICTVFNPDQEIAISNAPLDWTSPMRVLYQGQVQFEEIIQSENPDPQQIARMQFKATVRLSPPVRVYDASLIHEVDINIHKLEDIEFYYFGDNLEIVDMPTLDRLEIIASNSEIDEAGDQ